MLRLRQYAPLLLLSLALGAAGTACGTADGWEGSIEERDGIKVIRNEGRGLDDGKLREELAVEWTVGGDKRETLFANISWVEFDAGQSLYVYDSMDHKITRLGTDGRVQKQFGRNGQGPGELSRSRQFVRVKDRLYVANGGNGRIEVFGPDGEVFEPVHLPAVDQPSSIFHLGSSFYVGKRYVADGYHLYRFDESWQLTGRLRPAEPLAERVDYLRSNNIPCAAPDGFWIVHQLMNRIVKLDLKGKVLFETSRELDWSFPRDEKGKVIPEVLVHRECAADPAGNLYVVYSTPADWKKGNEVYKFGADGRLRGKAFDLPVYNASMIRFDEAGNFYFSDGIALTKARIRAVPVG